MTRSPRAIQLALFIIVSLSSLAAGDRLSPWREGLLDIHHITTGRGNATFFILPDGTTVLVDAGAAPPTIPHASAKPDDSRRPGEWVARYIQRVLPEDKGALDYVLVTHFHSDHMGGLADVLEALRVATLLDRGWPDYDYPRPLPENVLAGYRRLIETATSRGTNVERFAPGRKDQIVLRARPEAYPDFEIRNLTANGEYWTGVAETTRAQFPPLESLAPEDFPTENMCSLSFRLSYGSFDYYTGGDLTGIPNVGHPEWQNMEKAVAGSVGPVEVHVVNHHGSIDPASPEFLAALRPRVHILPSWSATHPAPSVLKRLLSERAYPGPRDVFALQFREPTKAAIGPRAERVQSDGGHVVVRVDPGGESYHVFVVTDADESGELVSRHGPYGSR